MNIFLTAFTICFAAAWAQLEEEFTITAGKTRRQGSPSFGQNTPNFYSNYGNFQQAPGYPINYGVSPAYLPIMQGANPTLVYSPQTGQIYSGYPIQQGPQQFNPNQQQMYNGPYQGYGGIPSNGDSNLYGSYGAGTAPGNQGTGGFLSDAFINSLNDKATTWTATRNFDETPDMYAYIGDLCGVIDPEVGKPNLLAPVSYNNKDIPAEFDARKYKPWSACTGLNEIRDQGSCGSCWAIAAVESMTDRICIATGGKAKPHISTEDLLECCKSCGKKCEGGYPGAAWTYYKEVGIVTGGEYNSTNADRGCKPYEVEPCAHHAKRSSKKQCSKGVQSPQCEKACENGASYNEDLHFGDIAYSVDSKVESIQLEILNYGPVEGAYDVYEDFVSYDTGVYVHTSGQKVGGHAIKMLGWGTENGVDYWLIANSWGYDWAGLGGFFKIRRGTNECNIESNIVAGKPRIGNQPAPSPPGPGPVFGPILTAPTSPLLNSRLNNGPKVIQY